MNAPETIFLLPDIQSEVDGRDLRIDAVGVKDLRYPITVQSSGTMTPTIATLSMTVVYAPFVIKPPLPGLIKGSAAYSAWRSQRWLTSQQVRAERRPRFP